MALKADADLSEEKQLRAEARLLRKNPNEFTSSSNEIIEIQDEVDEYPEPSKAVTKDSLINSISTHLPDLSDIPFHTIPREVNSNSSCNHIPQQVDSAESSTFSETIIQENEQKYQQFTEQGNGNHHTSKPAETTDTAVTEVLPTTEQLSKTTVSVGGSRRLEELQSHNLKELRMTHAKLEEKYRNIVKINAQLSNEKHVLLYELELSRDQMDEGEHARLTNERLLRIKREQLSLAQRQVIDLEAQIHRLVDCLTHHQNTLIRNGLILVSPEEDQEMVEQQLQIKDNISSASSKDRLFSGEFPLLTGMLVSRGTLRSLGQAFRHIFAADTIETSTTPTTTDKTSLIDENLDQLANALLDHVEKLTTSNQELQQQLITAEKQLTRIHGDDGDFNGSNGLSSTELRSSMTSANQSKEKLEIKGLKTELRLLKHQKHESTHKITALESEIIRLESQVRRYRNASENSEKQEEEAKAEKRKIQKELREMKTKLDDLNSEKKMLLKRLESSDHKKKKKVGGGG